MHAPRMFLLASLLSLGLPASRSFAADPPPAPDAVLSRAQLGRSEFSDVMFELRAGVPALATPALIDPYLLILDQLLDIHGELGFTVFDSGLLDAVARDLTRTAEPMMRIDTDSVELVTAFTYWATDDVRMPYCQRQQSVVAAVQSQADLLAILAKLAVAMTTIQRPAPFDNLPNASLAAPDFEKLQSLALTNLIKYHAAALTPDVFKQLMGAVHSSSGLEDVMDELKQEVFVKTDPAALKQLIDFSLAIAAVTPGFSPPANAEFLAEPPTVMMESLFKLLEVGGSLDAGVTDRVAALLTPDLIDTLGGRLLGMRLDMLNPSQFGYLAQLGTTIASRYATYGMEAERRAMESLVGEAQLADKLATTPVEGIYSVQMDQQEASVIVARTGPASVVVGLTVEGVPFSLSEARYNKALDSIEFSGVETLAGGGGSFPDDGDSSFGRLMRLKVAPDGQSVSGTFDNNLQTRSFAGRRLDSLTDYMKSPSVTTTTLASSPEGTYTGFLLGMDFEMLVARAGESYAATLVFSPSDMRISIALDAVYYEPRTGALYLTCLNTPEGRFIQMRGRLQGNTFVGDYIIGDREQTSRFTARK